MVDADSDKTDIPMERILRTLSVWFETDAICDA